MANTKEKEGATDRRDFLKLAGLGTVAGGAVVATAGAAQAETADLEAGSGYRETAHVQTYYELNKF